jgi:hypothetical protein
VNEHSHGVGDWVMRTRYGVAHLAESIVARDAVTRCGRRLTDEPTSGGDLVVAPFGTRKCRQCTATPEKETLS